MSVCYEGNIVQPFAACHVCLDCQEGNSSTVNLLVRDIYGSDHNGVKILLLHFMPIESFVLATLSIWSGRWTDGIIFWQSLV